MWRFESVYRPEKMRKARKCICKISKNFRVKKSGEKIVGSRVFAFGEDSLALRLVSKLPDLRAENADLHSAPVAQNRTKPRLPQPTQKPPNRVAFVLAGVAGFGPTNARVKVWCLTAWLYPNINLLFQINSPIIPQLFFSVKCFLAFL